MTDTVPSILTPSPVAHVACLNCRLPLLALYRDRHQRMYFLASQGVRVYARRAVSVVCAGCGQWRSVKLV